MKKLKIYTAVLLVAIFALFTACGTKTDTLDISALPDIQYHNMKNSTNSCIVTDGEYKYFAVKDTIYKAPLGTEDFCGIYKNEDIVILKIAVAEDKLYFSTVSDLYCVNKDGTDRQKIFALADSNGVILWQDYYVMGNNLYLKKGDSLIFRLEKTDTGYDTCDMQQTVHRNSRGMEYEFVRKDETGKGTLLAKKDNVTIPAENYIYNEDSFILTDNYIFYVSGKANDASADMKIYRCNPDDSNDVCIGQIYTQIQPVAYDDTYVYFKDRSHYYRINQNISGKHQFSEEDDVEYYGGPYEICDGRLYSVYTLDPQVVYFDSGMCEYINLK